MDIADILVIGSGAAATTTLIEVFTKLIEQPLAKGMLNITVVEKYAEFWKGIPYGSRSSVNALTITAISDFISSGKEKDLFFNWLTTNLDSWTKYYRVAGGIAADIWLNENLHLIHQNQWDAIYLPRFVFGMYLNNKMQSLLKTIVDKQLANVTLIQAEAIDIKSVNGLYSLTLLQPSGAKLAITTKKLLVAIGSAPVKNNVEKNTDTHTGYTYVNEFYEPCADDNLELLKNSLLATPDAQNRNLLIIGSNASSIELMYLLDNRPDLLELLNQIVTVSQTGIMPYHILDEQLDVYPCPNLDDIKKQDNYTIHTLIEAAKKDIAFAVNKGVMVPYVDRVIGYTIELMQPLDEESKKIFFGIYGPQLTRLIRRSGPAYKGAANNLISRQKLTLLKGSFKSVTANGDGGLLNYIDADGENQQYALPFKMVINCSGSNNLADSSSLLIQSLIREGLCQINLSGKGFLVNESFEASPNLYIMGPLLGGNMNKRIHFWHLENVARLLYLAPYLAQHILTDE